MKKTPSLEPEYLSVGEVSKRSGVAISALHFYEIKGLIKSHRNSGNQRRYHRRVLRELGFIKVAQHVGLTLEEILETLKTKGDFKTIAKKWEKMLDNRIELLQKTRNQLDKCIGCGCLSLKDCPLSNPSDKLGKKGPGPQLLIRD